MPDSADHISAISMQTMSVDKKRPFTSDAYTRKSIDTKSGH